MNNMMKPAAGIALVFVAALGAFAFNRPDDPPSTKITLAPTAWGTTHKVAQPEIATFAGGCFWGIEQGFRKTPGVIATAVGYSGGRVKNPTYKQVCMGTTGHTESCRVSFDPKVISYAQLTEKFFTMINPAQLNRQGPDFGTNYRSTVFYANDAQRAVAKGIMDRINSVGKYKGRVVTTLEAAAPFYMAEDYHQQYDEKHGIESCPAPSDD